MNCWILPDGSCCEVPPEGYYGFTYVVRGHGKTYFGKKAFLHRRKTKLSKKARTGTRKKVSIKQVDSKWLSYYGSCKPLLAAMKETGTSGYTRHILHLCKTRQELAYRELELLVKNDVLFRDDCWNSNILSRFFKGKL